MSSETTIPALIAERAQLQPDDIAYTFIDYEADPAGISDSLTWSELHERVTDRRREAREVGFAR